jgi:hypothetical protein
MKLALLIVGSVIVAALGWVVTTTLMLCLMNSRADLFVWPFTLWIETAAHWGIIGWKLRGTVVLAALLPTLCLIGIVVGLTRRRIGQPRSLYGDSGWADTAEQARNGVRQSARLP